MSRYTSEAHSPASLAARELIAELEGPDHVAASRVASSPAQLALLRALGKRADRPEPSVFLGAGTEHRIASGRALEALGLVTLAVQSRRVETTRAGHMKRRGRPLYQQSGEATLTPKGRAVLALLV